MIGARTEYTQRAVDRLRSGRQGDEILLVEMNTVVGLDCSEGKGDRHVRSAIRIVLSQYQIWWKRVRGADKWRCLTHSEREANTKHAIKLQHRRSGQLLKQAGTIRVEELDASQKVSHLLNLNMLGFMRLVTGSKARRQLESTHKVEQLKQPELPQLVQLMTNGKETT